MELPMWSTPVTFGGGIMTVNVRFGTPPASAGFGWNPPLASQSW
jgi:hypothetical protein